MADSCLSPGVILPEWDDGPEKVVQLSFCQRGPYRTCPGSASLTCDGRFSTPMFSSFCFVMIRTQCFTSHSSSTQSLSVPHGLQDRGQVKGAAGCTVTFYTLPVSEDSCWDHHWYCFACFVWYCRYSPSHWESESPSMLMWVVKPSLQSGLVTSVSHKAVVEFNFRVWLLYFVEDPGLGWWFSSID